MRKIFSILLITIIFIGGNVISYGQGVIMGSAPSYNEIDETTLTNFYDPGGIPDHQGENHDPNGYFATNLSNTMTLKTNITGSTLYIIFDEFGMGYGDTLYIYDGENVQAPLIGAYNSVRSPGEITATGRALTFVFHSDNIMDVGELSLGWRARANALLATPLSVPLSSDNNGLSSLTCSALFYDSGGQTGNIAENNATRWTEFTSPIGSHIKMEFTQFSVNGIMKIYDGQYLDPNKRLIGQFCTSTSAPPVLFSSSSTLSIQYVGAAGDMSKAGWAATISCVAELFESPDGSACPSVTIMSGDTSVSYIEYDCANPVNILTANVIATGRFSNDYTVNSITYNPPFTFSSGTSVNAQTDDNWVANVSLPFTFSFFGAPYTHAYPGANGLISFDPHTGTCAWSTEVPASTPPYNSTPYNYKNCIYGVYEDIYPGHYINGGAIKYDVMGTAPCRAFVFNYLNVGLFQCYSNGNNMYNTYQMVIYEGTNIIDVYIHHRANCSGWNGGRGVIGLQNTNSAQILTVPNRDFSALWTANDEAWRFTPITPMDEAATVTWYANSVSEANVIGTTKKMVVSPQETTHYIVKYHYTNAGGDSFDLLDTTTVHVAIPVVTAANNGGTASCPGDDIALHLTIAPNNFGINPIHYQWSSGDTTETCTVNPQETTTYTVTVTYSNGCTSTDTTSVNIIEMEAPIITGNDHICQGAGTTLTATHSTSNNFSWSNGSSAPSITVYPNDTTNYVVTATLDGNCHTTDTFTVYVWPNPSAGFYATPTDIFVQNGVGTVTCTNTSSPNCSLIWNFGDIYSVVNEVTDIEDPAHDYTHSGYYTITLNVADTNGCVDSIYTRVSVTVPYFFYIPNSFTPNGDGTNETFAPQGEGVDPAQYVMYIYDRSGQMMFKTNNPYDYWDGFAKNGKRCASGVYVYLIRLKTLNGDDKEYTGGVTLIR